MLYSSCFISLRAWVHFTSEKSCKYLSLYILINYLNDKLHYLYIFFERLLYTAVFLDFENFVISVLKI